MRHDIRLCFPNKVFRCKISVINIFNNPFDEVFAEDGQGTSSGDCSPMKDTNVCMNNQKQGIVLLRLVCANLDLTEFKT